MMEMAAGRFCWLDLAAADADAAADFYRKLFGWEAREQRLPAGPFTRLTLGDADVGSLYQLGRAHLEHGVPSHWTPYVHVEDLDAALERARTLGARCIVERFAVAGLANIALIADPGGALVGLWEPARSAADGTHPA
jgi:hypothetical protein